MYILTEIYSFVQKYYVDQLKIVRWDKLKINLKEKKVMNAYYFLAKKKNNCILCFKKIYKKGSKTYAYKLKKNVVHKLSLAFLMRDFKFF